METLASASPSPDPRPLAVDSVLFFASSPMAPLVATLEELPAAHTPGGTRRYEFRSTEVDPLSTGAAKRVLKKRGSGSTLKTLLASKVRARRRISTTEFIHPDSDSLKELRDMKDLLTEVPDMKRRLQRLEAANLDLYTPLSLNRELAVTNLIHSCLCTLDGVVADLVSGNASVDCLVSKSGPWPKKVMERLTYTNFWWFYYSQIVYEPTVSLDTFFSRVLGVHIPSPPPSVRCFPVVRSHHLNNLAVNIALPLVMVPAEAKVMAYLQPSESFDLRTMIGCYLSVFKSLRNDTIHLFEHLLKFKQSGTWIPNNPPIGDAIFLLNDTLSKTSLESTKCILVDIQQNLHNLGALQPLKPLVKALIERYQIMVDIDLAKPSGWELCDQMPMYWTAPEGGYFYSRRNGKFFRLTPEGNLLPYNPSA